MTKNKNKKKKGSELGKGIEQEEGEGIPLKMANEYRRSNKMELLTQEQFEARKAVIRANNQKAEEAIRRKSVQTLSDQTERSNIQSSSSSQSSSDTQLSQGASSVSLEEAEKIEAERSNLESARDFQRIANLEHYEEKAAIESKKAESENQTGLQLNSSIDPLLLAGTDECLNLIKPYQTLSIQTKVSRIQFKP
jgi:hypothetical protein